MGIVAFVVAMVAQMGGGPISGPGMLLILLSSAALAIRAKGSIPPSSIFSLEQYPTTCANRYTDRAARSEGSRSRKVRAGFQNVRACGSRGTQPGRPSRAMPTTRPDAGLWSRHV